MLMGSGSNVPWRVSSSGGQNGCGSRPREPGDWAGLKRPAGEPKHSTFRQRLPRPALVRHVYALMWINNLAGLRDEERSLGDCVLSWELLW